MKSNQPSRWPALAFLLLASPWAIAADPVPPAPGRPPAAAPPTAAAPAGDMTVDQALDALDQRGQDLRSFDGNVSLKELDANTMLGNARGQAAKIRQDAAAYKGQVVQNAEGEAARFVSVYNQYVKEAI